MKKFLIGLVLGLVVAFPLGLNVGKGQPLLSNPFTGRPLISKEVKETAENVSEKVMEETGELVEESTEAVEQSTQ